MAPDHDFLRDRCARQPDMPGAGAMTGQLAGTGQPGRTGISTAHPPFERHVTARTSLFERHLPAAHPSCDRCPYSLCTQSVLYAAVAIIGRHRQQLDHGTGRARPALPGVAQHLRRLPRNRVGQHVGLGVQQRRAADARAAPQPGRCVPDVRQQPGAGGQVRQVFVQLRQEVGSSVAAARPRPGQRCVRTLIASEIARKDRQNPKNDPFWRFSGSRGTSSRPQMHHVRQDNSIRMTTAFFRHPHVATRVTIQFRFSQISTSYSFLSRNFKSNNV